MREEGERGRLINFKKVNTHTQLAVIWDLVVLFGVLARLGPGLGLVFLRDLVSLKKERLENRVDHRRAVENTNEDNETDLDFAVERDDEQDVVSHGENESRDRVEKPESQPLLVIILGRGLDRAEALHPRVEEKHTL
eukprot:CAMPEP_0181271108 /NCGR_PEP_ID=MMETSP1097-20121128/7194_1 /TAXON_ID=35684 /ORGANISM="Pseudopedinella elastica, Strain CCMP716" /LENGTH=136 /DNA_ID=CAMNT_0023371453 /DNA_START=129 /DNA_END=536 /DNA_ORIENTATION=-